MLKPSFRSLVRNWWMVLLWLGVIRMESTQVASSNNTAEVLYKVVSSVAPHIQFTLVDHVDDVLRKTGHLLGYGILSALVFLALRNTNRDRVRALLPRSWGIYLRDLWRAEWAFIAVLFTMTTGAFDEIHQTFIPPRTGRWQDVIIDTIGACLMQWIVYRLSLRALKQSDHPTPTPELSSTR